MFKSRNALELGRIGPIGCFRRDDLQRSMPSPTSVILQQLSDDDRGGQYHPLTLQNGCQTTQVYSTHSVGTRELFTDNSAQIQPAGPRGHHSAPGLHSQSPRGWSFFGTSYERELLHWSALPGLQR